MLQDIKNCKACGLGKYVQTANESDSIYYRFTYYHSDKPSDEHNFMFILQNPGEISKEEKEELKIIIDDEAFISLEKDKMNIPD